MLSHLKKGCKEEFMEVFWGWHHPKEAEIGYYPDIPPEIFR